MCGIAGVAGFSNPDLVREMTARLRHRGPDAEGFHFDEEASLGHRRLSIIDLTGGTQPMANRDGTVVVSFNGQIYNYRQIKEDLSSEYEFQTNSDTEVLPVLYMKYGPAMVHHLRGMFAFAIWDSRTKELFLARDRVGVKPLYYAEMGGRILFASEPKSLLACPEVSKEIDPAALDTFLSLLYIPPPLSIYRGIRQLPPGHTLTWKDRKVEISQYWDAPPQPDPSRTEADWAEEIGLLLEESIRMRTMSDVPLGAFLSGGIDSSTIVAVLAEHSSHPVETFCIGFGKEGKAYEERPIAREISEFFGTNHHEMEIDLDLVNSLEPMVGGFDEPFGNPTAMLTYELSRFTRQFVTVSLAGDGGDEVFGGYPRYRGQIFADRLSTIPRFIRSPLVWAAQGKESSTARNWRRWARQLFEGADLPPHQRYENWVCYATPGEIDGLLSPEIQSRVAESDRLSPVAEYFQKPVNGDSVQRSVYADLHGFLPENVLRYSDRMSMAHSLEIRVPFTDHRLIETIVKVPSMYNVGWASSKRILSRIMKDRLPEKVLKRKKLGFNPPMGIWLQKNDNALIVEWLHPDLIRKRGLFREVEVRRLIEEHQSQKRDHGLRLWSLIVFEAWQRMYLD